MKCYRESVLQGLVEDGYKIIRDYLGISISDRLSAMPLATSLRRRRCANEDGIAIIQKLLSKLGVKLTYVGRMGSRVGC